MEFPDKSEPVGVPSEKNIKPVVTGAQKVERPATKRFFDFLFAESPKMLLAQVGRDVIVPRIKAGFEEAAGSFLSGMLWGGGSRPISGMVGQPTRAGGVSYSSISSGAVSPLIAAQQVSATAQTGSYQDIVMPNQRSAEVLLAGLFELYNRYRVVTVGDLYELADMQPPISGNSYGWTSLEGARITKHRAGYLLELPRPTLI